MLVVAAALVLGKPLRSMVCFAAVKLRLCSLPSGMGWGHMLLVGLLAGIGFTMAIFIATLAFDDAALLNAAKLGVLAASAVAAVVGLAWGLGSNASHSLNWRCNLAVAGQAAQLARFVLFCMVPHNCAANPLLD